MADQVIYLHGDLLLTIIEARSLPNMDLFSEHLRRCFTCECDASSTPRVSGDRKPNHHRNIITNNPYVIVCVPQTTLAGTHVINNSQHPKRDEHFNIPIAHPVLHLEFQVKDDDIFKPQIIGTVKIPAERIVTGEHITGWFPIIAPFGKPPKHDTSLKIDKKFTPCEKNPLYWQNTYFPVKKGGSVTLYQDAHCHDGLLPKIELEKGGRRVLKQQKCWEDICFAISEAHHLIYVVGWSIYDKIKLVREPTRPLPRGGDLTLGELLKYKSEEGVRVLMLVWNDKTALKHFATINVFPPPNFIYKNTHTF